MKGSEIIIIGAGGHAKSCIDVIESEGRYQIAGIVGVESEIGSRLFGYQVIGIDDDLPQLAKSFRNALVAVGQIKSSQTREELFLRIESCGFEQPAIISPKAYVSNRSTVGKGTIVMHHALINAGASIGENCIVNTGSIIEHDVVVGNNCHVATNSVLNGGVRLHESCFIGSGSVVRENIEIGEKSVIGMGLVVRHDLAACSNFVGS